MYTLQEDITISIRTHICSPSASQKRRTTSAVSILVVNSQKLSHRYTTSQIIPRTWGRVPILGPLIFHKRPLFYPLTIPVPLKCSFFKLQGVDGRILWVLQAGVDLHQVVPQFKEARVCLPQTCVCESLWEREVFQKSAVWCIYSIRNPFTSIYIHICYRAYFHLVIEFTCRTCNYSLMLIEKSDR